MDCVTQKKQQGKLQHNPMHNVDICIVGGGIVGSILALSLANLYVNGNKLNVALVESHLINPSHPGFDARSLALSYGSISKLMQLGIWQKIAHLGSPIQEVSISDRGYWGMTHIDAKDYAMPYLGHVIDLQDVGCELTQLLNASSVMVFCPDTLIDITPHKAGHHLLLASGNQIFTQLLIAGDGANSFIRQQFNLSSTVIDFNQMGIVANVSVNQDHHHCAWERFTDKGPIALLPLKPIDGTHRLSLVWAMDNEQAIKRCQLSDDEFLTSLQDNFGYRAGQFTKVGKRHSYPLLMSYMPRPIYHRTVFIGNAAQTLHPIAGQGFNLAMRDIADLCKVVHLAMADNNDIGNTKLIHHYLQLRSKDRDTTLTAIEVLVRTFSNQHSPLIINRNMGLRLLSWLPPFKKIIAKKAMGL